MNMDDFSIALRIRHPSIDPAEVTRQLGIVPRHAWRAGEPREIDEGEVGSPMHRETYWLGLLAPRPEWRSLRALVSSLENDRVRRALGPRVELMAETFKSAATHPLEVVLNSTLLRMKRAAGFWREFAEQGGTVECQLQVHKVDLFQLDFPPAFLLALVELKINLSIEVDGPVRAAA